jgi:hypothetical protein
MGLCEEQFVSPKRQRTKHVSLVIPIGHHK